MKTSADNCLITGMQYNLLSIHPHEYGHFNGKGYELAADYVLEQLFKEGIFDAEDR